MNTPSNAPEAPRYSIKTLNDLLTVPAERRGAMLKELERALLLFGLVHEGDPSGAPPFSIEWDDDGCDDSAIYTETGELLLRMAITKQLAGAEQPGHTDTKGEPAAL